MTNERHENGRVKLLLVPRLNVNPKAVQPIEWRTSLVEFPISRVAGYCNDVGTKYNLVHLEL
jgi:hypothetical protein